MGLKYKHIFHCPHTRHLPSIRQGFVLTGQFIFHVRYFLLGSHDIDEKLLKVEIIKYQ
jgi:hypothetical protein